MYKFTYRKLKSYDSLLVVCGSFKKDYVHKDLILMNEIHSLKMNHLSYNNFLEFVYLFYICIHPNSYKRNLILIPLIFFTKRDIKKICM